MPCAICSTFPLRTLRELNEEIDLGDLSVFELARRYNISEPVLQDHIRLCLMPLPDTGYELLEQMLRDFH